MRSIEFLRTEYPALCMELGLPLPQIDLAKISRVNNGVRPFRESGVRIELTPLTQLGKTMIHHYGHGAQGWTIAYATAQEAVHLFEEAVQGGYI